MVRALLVSTYDLGRQPLGLAAPASRLRGRGIDVRCVDTSRDPLEDRELADASLIAFHLPMHTATRLAGPLIERARRVNPSAPICTYGLYSPLNAEWLRSLGVHHVLGAEGEDDLERLAVSGALGESISTRAVTLPMVVPDRAGLPPLERYASLRLPDGTRRVAGATDATRGCKHLCRHCPIVPVYEGRFRAVPLDVVLADVRGQVAAGAQHISFGDPDFFNGPTHARRLVEAVARDFPGLTYDATIKIEHLLKHADLLPVLRQTGCVFVTSAVETIDDEVLGKLRKGHTRADFIRAVGVCREADLALSPTFVPFTPWTDAGGYLELLDLIDDLALVEHVAPIQLAIRLLVTSGSALLELPEIRDIVAPFDPASLTWPWTHHDAGVDSLQRDVMTVVASGRDASRSDTFARVRALAAAHANAPARAAAPRQSAPIATITEPWYCCAEPAPALDAM